MAQTAKAIRRAYDAKTYRRFNWRVRKNSELCEKIEQAIAAKGISLNHIITKQLADFFKVPMPEPHMDADL